MWCIVLVAVTHLASAMQLAGFGSHFLVRQNNNQVYAVGSNVYGQLGLGTNADATLPQPMLNAADGVDLCAGSQHSCVIKGVRVWCTGNNEFYQLGIGNVVNQNVLGAVTIFTLDAVKVTCGVSGTCALISGGTARCWGKFAGTTYTSSPYTATISGGIQSMALGDVHACFVAVGGALSCMGVNLYGQLGTGNFASQSSPTLVVAPANVNIVSVACGVQHTCAINVAGAVYCWGSNADGRLGNTTVATNTAFPTRAQLTPLGDLMNAGPFNSFVLVKAGIVFSFGRDIYGVFGTGGVGNQPIPIVFGQGQPIIVSVCGGFTTACVLLLDGRVRCTGSNSYGQLGIGSTTSSLTLVTMQGLPTVAPTATAAPSATPR